MQLRCPCAEGSGGGGLFVLVEGGNSGILIANCTLTGNINGMVQIMENVVCSVIFGT